MPKRRGTSAGIRRYSIGQFFEFLRGMVRERVAMKMRVTAYRGSDLIDMQFSRFRGSWVEVRFLFFRASRFYFHGFNFKLWSLFRARGVGVWFSRFFITIEYIESANLIQYCICMNLTFSNECREYDLL